MAKQKDDKLDALFAKGLPETTPVESALRVTANGRKIGKHKNPEWGKFTILLKKNTQQQAFFLAKGLNPPRDLSDVAEELLSQWIRENKRT